MVTLSGPNSTFPNQGLKSQHPFRRRINQLISLTSYGGNQKTLQGSQPPVSAGVGLAQFIQDYSRAILKRYYIISISCQGIKYSILLWTTQFIRTGLIQSTCIGLGPIGSFHIPLWEFHHTVQDSRWPELYFPIRTIQPLIHLPGSIFQFSHIPGLLSSP
ncbi:hypothetical protein O181_124998 [Austropuccinia psidii MF-1]|uniref:Uncharacterized protein n=1 Tax=Austropuccinia psidii MF-1 TaxID=1389203 RepID=A0A9Q3KNX4_9BASI|nr:hypothetical protein [Austropuccinia psidii MF-1]